MRRSLKWTIQLTILAAILAVWQYGPKIGAIRGHVFFADPYFISSPSRIVHEVIGLATGSDGSILVWSYLRSTLIASISGILIGAAGGALVGLWLSNNSSTNVILRPFLVAINAIPRIALIPVIIILFGPTLKSATFTAVTVVFFIVFFNAFEGGKSVPPEVISNARLLGAGNLQLMYYVRWKYVLAWTMASLPNAVTLGLVTTITAEVLSGAVGMGRLIVTATTTVNSDLTFAVVVILAAVGTVLVTGAALLERRWLHWWGK